MSERVSLRVGRSFESEWGGFQQSNSSKPLPLTRAGPPVVVSSSSQQGSLALGLSESLLPWKLLFKVVVLLFII